jgi:DNA-binding GntR family transcriptional regulator
MIVSKREMVYREIKEHILTGKLKNNVRVTERALAEKLGVTRVPIREGLVKLEQDGLIRKIPSTGYIVEHYSSEEMEEAMLIRFTIECHAASKAALKATKEEIAELKTLNTALKNAGHANNIEIVIELDREFHFAVIKASRSKVLNKLYSIISIPVFHHREIIGKTDADRTFSGHSKIIEAIENKDADAAFILTFRHTPGRTNFKNAFYSDIAQDVLSNSK